MGIRPNMLGESYLVKRMTVLSKGGVCGLQNLRNGLQILGGNNAVSPSENGRKSSVPVLRDTIRKSSTSQMTELQFLNHRKLAAAAANAQNN